MKTHTFTYESLNKLVHACILPACLTKPYDGSYFYFFTERVKHWYNQTVGSMQGDREALCYIFFLAFFPISRVVNLRSEVLSFKQKEQETLGTSWARFNDLITSGPNLAIQDPILLQHFCMGLSKNSVQFLDLASRGAFLHFSASKAGTILDKIIGHIPYTDSHDELPKEEEESTPEQEEEALIAKSQPLQSQDLAINPGPPISQNPKEEETQPLQFPFEIENDFFFDADCGNTLNFHFQKIPS
jgi:hypothetical protein